MPQKLAGRVIEPPVCEPIAPEHMPSATATAEPLLEPPGVRSRFQGLRVGGGAKQANSVVTVLPRMIAPAARSFATTAASRWTGSVEVVGEAARVGQPATSTISLIP